MTQLAEQFYAGGFLIREAPGMVSRVAAVLTNPSTTAALSAPGGLVLSMSPPTAAAAAPLGTNQGNGVVGTVSTGPTAIPGAYIVNFESATAFTIADPTNVEIAHGTAGAPITAGGLTFTVTPGATVFSPGDAFAITVAPADGSYIPFTGAQRAAVVLFDRVTVAPGSTQRVTAIVQAAEVNAGEIQWDPSVISAPNAGALQAAAAAALNLRGIELRAVSVAAF